MWTNQKSVSYIDMAGLSEDIYCTPERGRARAWLFAKEGGFRVYLSIVGPKRDKFKGDFPLSDSQAEGILEAISNLIKTLDEEIRR